MKFTHYDLDASEIIALRKVLQAAVLRWEGLLDGDRYFDPIRREKIVRLAHDLRTLPTYPGRTIDHE